MNNEQPNHDKNDKRSHAERLADQIRAALQGPPCPPEIASVMERDNRGCLSDVASDHQIFLEEIQQSKALLLPAIGYISHAMHETRSLVASLMSPAESESLLAMAAPSVIGYEEMGPSLFENVDGMELSDMAMLACIAAVKAALVSRIRKFCGCADMLATCKKGEGPPASFAVGMMESMVRIIRMMDKIGITLTEKEQARFDVAGASLKLQRYIKDRATA